MIDKLLADIRVHRDIAKHYNVLNGLSGYALLQHYEIEADDFLYSTFKRIVESIDKLRFSYVYGNGISGLLWVMNFIKESKNVDYLDAVIETLNRILLETYNSNINSKYDFFYGNTGIVHYLIDYNFNSESKDLIKKFLLDLNNDTIKKREGSYYIQFENIKNQQKNSIDFGLAHGISSIVQVLSRIFKMGFENEIVSELLTGYINFLLSNKNNVQKAGSNFPSTFDSKGVKSRLAWCYGDLGTAIAIWQAGDNTGTDYWKEEAEKILIQTTKRTTLNDGMIVDPMICHGTSGIATIYNRMWRNTRNSIFLDARDHWLGETKKFAKFADGISGYKYFNPIQNKWLTQFGLLEGSVGIALAFLQAESKEDIKWDRVLLISS